MSKKSEQKCNARIGFKKLIVPTSKKGVSKIIDNPFWSPLFGQIGNWWEHKTEGIPTDEVLCGKHADIEVTAFIESPFAINHWQVVKHFKCEHHAKLFIEESEKKKQEIIGRGGKFVTIHIANKGNGNNITHTPLELD